MNQVQVPPFGLILRQDVAMATRNPLECLRAFKIVEKMQKNAQNEPPWAHPRGALGPLGPLALRDSP